MKPDFSSRILPAAAILIVALAVVVLRKQQEELNPERRARSHELNPELHPGARVRRERRRRFNR